MWSITPMGHNFSKSLKNLRKDAGMTQDELAEKVGVSKNMIVRYELGTASPGFGNLVKLSEALGASYDQIMGTARPSSSFSVQILDPYSFVPDVIHERTAYYQAVPVYEAAVIGGPPEEVQSERAKTIAFLPAKVMKGHDPKYVACFEVKGESMDPVVRPGALVAVDLSERPPRPGSAPAETKRKSIWIVRKGGGLCIKHIRVKDGVIVLVSANPAEDVEVVTDPEAIIGKVFYVGQGMG